MALNENIRIKQIQAGTDSYEISARYILTSSNVEKSYEDILDLIGEKAGVVILQSLPQANAESYATYKNNLVLVPARSSTTSNAKDEYVIVRTGTTGNYTYYWEQVGTTQIDLDNYWKLGDQYNGAALSSGAHTHTVSGTVTVPTIAVDKTKKLGLSPDTQSLSTYDSTSTKLVTTTLTPVGGTTTVATNTGHDEISYVSAVASEAQTSTGAITYVESVAATTLTGTKTFNTDAIKNVELSASATSTDGPLYVQDASLGGTTTFNTDAIKNVELSASGTSTDGPVYIQEASLSGGSAGSAAATASAFNSASVDNNGVLSFGTGTFATSGLTGVAMPTLNTTPKYMKVTKTNASTADVTLSTTPKYMKATKTNASTGTVGISSGVPTTKYLKTTTTSADIPTLGSATVATAGSDITYATGATSTSGTGADVISAVTPGTAYNVWVGATITENTTNAGPVIEHTTTSTASASLTNGSAASAGAHTHDVKPEAGE